MKLGVALLIVAAMAMATADIPKEEKNEVVLKKVRVETGERGTDFKLRQAYDDSQTADAGLLLPNLLPNLENNNNNNKNLEAEIHAIVDAKLTAYQKKSETAAELTAYQKKSETAAAIKSYLNSHSIRQSGMRWNVHTGNPTRISYSPAFSKTPTLAVSLSGFRTYLMKDVPKSDSIKTYASENVSSKSKSGFTISWKDEQKNIYTHGITWIACM